MPEQSPNSKSDRAISHRPSLTPLKALSHSIFLKERERAEKLKWSRLGRRDRPESWLKVIATLMKGDVKFWVREKGRSSRTRGFIHLQVLGLWSKGNMRGRNKRLIHKQLIFYYALNPFSPLFIHIDAVGPGRRAFSPQNGHEKCLQWSTYKGFRGGLPARPQEVIYSASYFLSARKAERPSKSGFYWKMEQWKCFSCSITLLSFHSIDCVSFHVCVWVSLLLILHILLCISHNALCALLSVSLDLLSL